jgi:AraC-like DNA-binding protein
MLGRYLIKLFFGLVILALVAVISLFSVMNNRYMNATEQEIVGFSQEALDETSRHAEFIMRQVVAFAVDLYYNPVVSAFVHGAETSEVELHELVSTLRQRKSSHDFVHSVFVYNSELGLRGADSTYHRLTIGGEDVLARMELPMDGRFAVYPGEFVRSANAATELIISFVYTHVATGSSPPGQAIIVNVFEDSFAAELADDAAERDAVFVVADADGTVLSSSDKDRVGALVPAEWRLPTPEAADVAGSVRIGAGDAERLVAYRWNGTLDWWLYRVIPYAGLLRQARVVQRDMYVALAVVIALCLLLGFVVSRRLYRPIYSLLEAVSARRGAAEFNRFRNEIQYIREEGESDRRLMRSEFFRNMMLTELSSGTITRVVQRLGPDLPEPPLSIMVFSLDATDDLSDDDMTLLQYYVTRRLESRIAGQISDIVPVTGNRIAIVVSGLQSPGGGTAETLGAVATAVREDFNRRVGRTLTVSVPEPAFTFEEIRAAYLQAEALLRHRMLTGPDGTHTSADLAGRSAIPFEYPEEMERSIVTALREGKFVEYESEVSELLDYSRKYDYRRFSYLVIQAATAILKQMNTALGDAGPDAFTDFETLVLQFRQMDDLDQVRTLFQHLYRHYHQTRLAIQERARGQQHELIARVKRHVEEHLASPLLSVEMLASQFSYSTGHLSRVFKSSEGENLSDFINRLRFEKARDLLASTDDTVDEIAHAVGFANVNYFYTAFKKAIGVTPAVYRTINGKTLRS